MLQRSRHSSVFFGRHCLPEHDKLEVIKEDSRRIKPEHFDGIDAVIDLVSISNDPSSELFKEPIWEINRESRVCTATMGKEAGV